MSGGPSASRRGRLNRERVLHAALTVADAEGLAAVSMRRVAVELGVETMALYRYTASKEDLLDGLVETLFLELEERLSSARRPNGAETPGETAPEIPAETLTATPAETHTEIPAETPAAIPAEAPTEIPAETLVDVTAETPVGPPLGLSDLRDALHAIAREMYRVAVAHPNIISLCATRPLMVPLARRPQAVLRVHERLLTLLRAAGLEGLAALRVYRAFTSWVLGYIVIDLRAVVDDPDEPDPAFRLGLHRLPARDFPTLREYGPTLAERGGEEQLTAGLDALLASLVPDAAG